VIISQLLQSFANRKTTSTGAIVASDYPCQRTPSTSDAHGILFYAQRRDLLPLQLNPPWMAQLQTWSLVDLAADRALQHVPRPEDALRLSKRCVWPEQPRDGTIASQAVVVVFSVVSWAI